MVFAAFLCVDRSLLVMDTEPFNLPVPSGLNMGVYQTSAPYVKPGTETVEYSCLASLGLTFSKVSKGGRTRMSQRHELWHIADSNVGLAQR